MPIVNIIDNRSHEYRWRQVHAVVEAAWHDNACADADQIDNDTGPDFAERINVSLHDAIVWAMAIPEPVTLYIYGVQQLLATGETS